MEMDLNVLLCPCEAPMGEGGQLCGIPTVVTLPVSADNFRRFFTRSSRNSHTTSSNHYEADRAAKIYKARSQNMPSVKS